MRSDINSVILFFFVLTVSSAQNNVSGESVPPPQDPYGEIYTIVEQNAEFPGGVGEMHKYIITNITMPAEAREAGISGKCYLKFIVSSTGDIARVEVLKGVPECPACDKEALRVVKSMPKWTPGIQNGKAVNIYYNLPISFKNSGFQGNAPQSTLTPEQQAAHDKAMIYYNQGHKLDQQGKYKEALEKFNISLTHEAENKYSLFDKARMLVTLGDKGQACEIWRKMVSLKLRADEAEEFIKKNCN